MHRSAAETAVDRSGERRGDELAHRHVGDHRAVGVGVGVRHVLEAAVDAEVAGGHALDAGVGRAHHDADPLAGHEALAQHGHDLAVDHLGLRLGEHGQLPRRLAVERSGRHLGQQLGDGGDLDRGPVRARSWSRRRRPRRRRRRRPTHDEPGDERPEHDDEGERDERPAPARRRRRWRPGVVEVDLDVVERARSGGPGAHASRGSLPDRRGRRSRSLAPCQRERGLGEPVSRGCGRGRTARGGGGPRPACAACAPGAGP